MPSQSPSRTAQKDMRDAGHSAFSNDLSKFRKLKDEVVKNAQSYIRRRATVIFHTLSPDHEAVKCLSAFGDQAQKFAAEVLAIIEWGTQHWKLQETFPVPVIPRWLRTPEFTQWVPADVSPWRRNWMPPPSLTPYSRARELRDHERRHTTVRL